MPSNPLRLQICRQNDKVKTQCDCRPGEGRAAVWGRLLSVWLYALIRGWVLKIWGAAAVGGVVFSIIIIRYSSTGNRGLILSCVDYPDSHAPDAVMTAVLGGLPSAWLLH